MKYLCSLVLAFGGVAGFAGLGHADATRVTGVVETPNAVFFQPSQFPTVVWFFPRTQLDLSIVPPQLPTGTFWRAAVVFNQVTADDLAALPPEWAGKSFVPFIVRPTTECTLTRLAEMRFVIQEVKAQGHDVSSANPPVCRFSFRLPTVMPPDLRDRLDALVSSDTLVERILELDLLTEATIAWADVYDAVAATLAEPDADPELTPEAARAAILRALDSPALAVVRAAITPAEQQALLDAALATLFTSVSARVVRLLAAAPPASFVYHLEPFHRFM